jgi:uncharacterized protein (DUF362 family)
LTACTRQTGLFRTAKVVLTQSGSKEFTEADVAETVNRALDELGFEFGGVVGSVVIKPNMCYYWDCSTGETTDPRVVSAVIDYVRRKLGDDVDITVAEADASAMKTKFAFSILGYDKLCREKGVKLQNLSEGAVVEAPVEVRGKEFTLPINEVLLKADLLINVPKLKTHNFVGATCALKNMFGAISKPRKFSYHSRISDVIVGVNKIVKSDLVVVDGFVGKGSCTKKLGVVLAGDDALATDYVAARAMGFNPKRLGYLRLAAEEGLGESRNIELVEHIKLAEIRRNFPSYSHTVHNISWNLQLKMLRSYARLVGDVLPSFLEA